MSDPFQRKPEHVPSTDFDPSSISSPFVPATREQYLTWLEGYLMNGGAATFVEETDSPLLVDGAELIALEPFTLNGEGGRLDNRRIIVSDGVEWEGNVGRNTLFLFEGFQLIGRAPTVVVTSKIAELGNSIRGAFLDSFQGTVKACSDPRIMNQDDSGVYQQHVRETLDKYSRMAKVLRLEIGQDEIQAILIEAEQERDELLATIGPDYQGQQTRAAFNAIKAAYSSQRTPGR